MRYINFYETNINDDDIKAVTDVLKSGWITTGPKTKEFEEKISKYCDTKRTACLNSATACMSTALRLLGVSAGDEVITTAFTYTATVSAIIHTGATPVIVDTYKDSFEMNLEQLKSKITSKTKAVIAVDIAGFMCDYDEIFDVVNSKKSVFSPNSFLQHKMGRVAVISDAAHSFGSIYKCKNSGSVADFTCFSFHAVKNITTAEGGALTWRTFGDYIDQSIYDEIMLLSLHGQSRDALSKATSGTWEYDVIEPYYKCNMTDISAALGISQLERYNDTLTLRNCLVERYTEKLNNDNIEIMTKSTDNKLYNGHLFIIRLKGKSREFRDKLIFDMSAIKMNVHFKPIPMLSAYQKRGFLPGNFPEACSLFENIVSLPLHNNLSVDDVDYISEKILQYMEKNND